MAVAERRARLRERPGVLGRWCRALERTQSRFRRAEREAATVVHRAGARLVRWFFDLLALALIAVVELDVVRRKAANALADNPRR